jgi:hypothetical protein
VMVHLVGPIELGGGNPPSLPLNVPLYITTNSFFHSAALGRRNVCPSTNLPYPAKNTIEKSHCVGADNQFARQLRIFAYVGETRIGIVHSIFQRSDTFIVGVYINQDLPLVSLVFILDSTFLTSSYGQHHLTIF